MHGGPCQYFGALAVRGREHAMDMSKLPKG